MIYTTLDNFYLTAEQLEDSPSRQDGITADDETRARVYGCEIIQEAGMLLRLPQVTMATGQVLLHRFFCKQSLAKRDIKVFSMACLFLATKLEETARKHREIISVFHRLERRREGRSLEPLDFYGNVYSEKKLNLVRAEKMILTQLGFILHVDHPHKDMLNYLHYLQASPQLMQVAWNLTNDSLRTTLCVRFKSKIVACGIIFTAARTLQEPLPESPPWWEVFSVDLADMCMVCREIFKLYHLEKAAYVNFLKRAGASAASNASPAPAQLAPAISAGHSGGEPAELSSQGPSPMDDVEGKDMHQAESLKAGKSGPDTEGRPASSGSNPSRQPDKDSSSRQQARQSAHPSDRHRVQSSGRDGDSRERHRDHRDAARSRGLDRSGDSDRYRAGETRRERPADRDSRHYRSKDDRSRDRERDRERIKPADSHASHRTKERERSRQQSSQRDRDGSLALKSDRARSAEREQDSKRRKASKQQGADVPARTKEEKQPSTSSTEKGSGNAFTMLKHALS